LLAEITRRRAELQAPVPARQTRTNRTDCRQRAQNYQTLMKATSSPSTAIWNADRRRSQGRCNNWWSRPSAVWVTPAQPLMVIVPKENVLEVEAMLPNKDIGFVNPGQDAEVKVETFPFTKYGTIHGKITQVSSDAIQDEKPGLIYSTRVKLAQDTIRVENKAVRLSPGMAVTVEVKTGTRRVIEYFLSPLMQVTSESLRER
jgi:HlyD family type I secretion membrane fusion protein